MTDTDPHIPTSGGRSHAECDDCGHAGHFRTVCKRPGCGCPSGIDRKKARDEGLQSVKADSVRNTSPGFF